MEQRERRRVPLVWLLTPFVALAVVGTVADVLGPKLITERPLLQMFLNPKNRYYLLAAPQVDAVPFFVVGFIRLVLTDPLMFILGRQYGDAAIKWAEEKLGDEGGMIRTVERWFGKVAWLVILIAPSAYWNVLAGASGMKVRLYVVLNLIGTVGRLVLFWVAAETFKDELMDVLDFIQRYQWWLVGASFLLVALHVGRRGSQGVLETPAEIAAEIEAEEEELRD